MNQQSLPAIPYRKFLKLAVIEHAVFALPVLSILLIVQAIPFYAVLLFLFAISILGIPLSAGITWLIAKGSNWVNARAAIIANGIYPGQVYVMLLGGMVGFRQWGVIGGIISAVFLFAAGSWAGAKLAEFLYKRITLGSSSI